MNTPPNPMTISEAQAAMDAVIAQFHVLCAEGRESPAPIDVFVKNRIAFDRACNDFYYAQWLSVADTGIQIMRAKGDIRDIDTKPYQ